MVFSNAVFLCIFLPVTIVVYFVLEQVEKNRSCTLRNSWLTLVSFLFYAWNRPEFTLLLAASIGVNYIGGLAIGGRQERKKRYFILLATITADLGLLFYFKYFNLVIYTCNLLLSGKAQIHIPQVILPIGISFFTFQGMSYVIDVYRGKSAVQKNVMKLAMFISMFPQLVAGPIVRYTDIQDRMDDRTTMLSDFVYGIKRFIIGLFKKVVIADSLAVAVDGIFGENALYLTVPIVWLGALAYALQIFFDFAGYSDMAIGLGRMFGFTFGENFCYPYISSSVTEFWRRWHISLSSFFRDYVYIPLGGNRKHVYRNLAIVFLLTGLWHGAAYTYILWGIWHGAFILAERALKRRTTSAAADRSRKLTAWLTRPVKHLYALTVVLIGWVIFRSDGLYRMANYLKAMFGGVSKQHVFTVAWFFDKYTSCILIVALLMATPLVKRTVLFLKEKLPAMLFLLGERMVLTAALLVCLMRIAANSYSAFIYFQF